MYILEVTILTYMLNGAIVKEKFKYPRHCWWRQVELTAKGIESECDKSYRLEKYK